MATEIPVLDTSDKTAGADLSTKQYCWVKETATTIVAVSDVTDQMAGVLQNKPKLGESAVIRRVGISKVKCGGTISVPGSLGTDATGKAIALTPGTDTTKYVGGHPQEAGVNGDLITASINTLNVHRAS